MKKYCFVDIKFKIRDDFFKSHLLDYDEGKEWCKGGLFLQKTGLTSNHTEERK
jgi:hypothetical protein